MYDLRESSELACPSCLNMKYVDYPIVLVSCLMEQDNLTAVLQSVTGGTPESRTFCASCE